MALPATGEISFRDFNTDRGRPATSEIDMDSAAIAYGIPSKPHGMDEFRGRAVGGVTTAAPTTAPPTTAPPTTAPPQYYRIQFCDNFSTGNSFAYPAGSFSVNARVSADNNRTAIVTSISTSNPGGTLLSLTSLGATGCPTTTTSTTTTTTTTTLASVSFNLFQLGCDGTNPTLRANNFTGGNNSWSYVKIGTSQANAAISSPIYIAFNESNYDFLGVYQLLNNQTYYVILADDGGRTAMRSITTAGCFTTTTAAPTTAAPTTAPPPTYNIFYLGYGTTSSSEACSAAQGPIYILQGDTFTTATYLYSDEGSTYAASGYYSNGSQWRYWDALSTSITSPNNCSTGGGPEEIN